MVFTLNCTMALNMVLKGLLCEGGHIVVSSLEHNAVMRPLKALSAGAPVYSVATVVPENPEETVRNFRRCITPQTKAPVSYTHLDVYKRQLHDSFRRLGIKGGGVLVKHQNIDVGHTCDHQGQGLPLSARQGADRLA